MSLHKLCVSMGLFACFTTNQANMSNSIKLKCNNTPSSKTAGFTAWFMYVAHSVRVKFNTLFNSMRCNNSDCFLESTANRSMKQFDWQPQWRQISRVCSCWCHKQTCLLPGDRDVLRWCVGKCYCDIKKTSGEIAPNNFLHRVTMFSYLFLHSFMFSYDTF